MILHIFDVKQTIYVGQSRKETVCRGVIEDQGRYRPNDMRVGAICYLFDKINVLRNDSNNVICLCCDSRPTYKIQLLMDVFGIQYKGGRPKASDFVNYQYDFVVELLKQMNFNVYKEESYEADDLISSLVYKYKNVFDEIIIHTNDSDQYYLIDKHVRCDAVSSTVRDVDYSGYVEACSKKRKTPYNTVMLNKMLYGEPGDNVPQLGPSYVDYASRCIPDVAYPFLGDAIILRTIIKALSQDEEKAMCVCDCITPRLLLDERTSINVDKQPDWNMFIYYSIAFGCAAYRNFELPDNELGESVILSKLKEINE